MRRITTAVSVFLLITAIRVGGQPLTPDPLDLEGDAIYSLYRKNFIGRHLSTNGRVMEWVALESVEEFNPATYDGSGRINITGSDGGVVSHRIDNVRYSMEVRAPLSSPQPYLWVPAVGLAKDPGSGNTGYYAVGGGGDNPLYWGGMALATLSLEAIHGVSPYSIIYARRIMQHALRSEMPGRNGYITRTAHHFNSFRSKNGERIIQGASSEELLGLMLGLMYYIKAENPSHPLRAEAIALRDRVLKTISKGSIFARYQHPFMISHSDPHYYVKTFEFPLNASLGSDTTPTMRALYRNMVTLSTGASRNVAEFFGDTNFFDYPMFLTSMVLILDGDLSTARKQEYAKIFMQDFIKAALTSGPDREDLEGNAYMGVVAKLTNRYLNSQLDSEASSTTLTDIWSGNNLVWQSLLAAVEMKIASPKSLHNGTIRDMTPAERNENRLSWQHNLPLLKIDPPPQQNYWTNFNPLNRIGGHFIWHDRWPFVFKRAEWKWKSTFPASYAWSDAWVPQPVAANDNAFRLSTAKRRSLDSYLTAELRNHRGHGLNQVEGAGLDLLFLRMLLTQINPTKYPAPRLTEDRAYNTIPFGGASPGSPDLLRYGSHTAPFDIGGDDGSLTMASANDEVIGGANGVVAYPDTDDRLVLSPVIAVRGTIPSKPEVMFGSSRWTGPRYDKVRLVVFPRTRGEAVVVAVQRAEENELPCDDHWLRLTSFRFTFAPDRAGSLERLATWQDPPSVRYCDGKEYIDATAVGPDHLAVIFRTRHEKNRIAMFRVNSSSGQITQLPGVIDAAPEENPPKSIAIVSTHGRFVISATQTEAGRYRLRSRRFENGSLVQAGISSTMPGRLLDLVAVRKLDYTQPEYTGGWYVVAAADENPYVRIDVWTVSSAGVLTWNNRIRTEFADNLLVPRERQYAHAEMFASYYNNRNGFVLVGKGVARAVNGPTGVRSTSSGLKVVYGRILPDGRPTLLDSEALGSGDEDAMEVIAGTRLTVPDSDFPGIATAHKSKDDELILSTWYFDDEFTRNRWP